MWVAASIPGAEAATLFARHTTGAQTIRGTASRVTKNGFTLLSPSKGPIQVSVSKDTKVTGGSLRAGAHIGVHGFVRGKSMVAITVRVYPSKSAPKARSVRGVVAAVHGSEIDVRAGRSVIRTRVSSATVVRIGSKLGRGTDIHLGDRVEMRLLPGAGLQTAVHVHVYRQKTAGRSVELTGVLSSVGSTQISLTVSGRQYRISLNGTTKVYLGRHLSNKGAIRRGMHARVFSCCQGGSLTAHSIHLSRTLSVVKQVTIRGLVTSAGRTSLRLSTPAAVDVSFGRSSTFEVGARKTSAASIRALDYVSVRGTRSGARFVATRIHVYLEYRKIRSLSGTVVGPSKGHLVLLVRGKRIAVSVSGPSSLKSFHPGDRVTGTGRLEGPGNMHVISLRVVPPKLTTVHGVVLTVASGRIQILVRGKRLTLSLGRVRPSLGGSAAPSAAIFPGVRVTALGTASGSSFRATSVAVLVLVRTVSGRITSLKHSVVQVKSSRVKNVSALLSSSTSVTDVGRRLPSSSLAVGTFVQLKLFEASPQLIHVASLLVLHPLLTFTALVLRLSPHLAVREANGEVFALNVGGTTAITSSVGAIPVQFLEIPVGLSVRVSGRADSYGAVVVRTLAVRLHARTVRGKLLQTGPQGVQVQVGSQLFDARVWSGTAFSQGSKAFDPASLVTDDDVTVYGYDTLPGKMIARKVLVHRRLVGISGQISSVTDHGFVLNAADGQHPVVLSQSTVWTRVSPAGLAAGLTVHVTGYLRGDGSVMATRVRLGK
jgi:hypothetical protein